MRRILWFVLFLFVISFAFAQQPADKTKKTKPATPQAQTGAPPMPKPSPGLKKITDMLVGTWNVEETHEPSPWAPKGGTGTAVEVQMLGPGGMSLWSTYRTTAGPMKGFRGQGVMWWDAKSGLFKGVWCDTTDAGCMAGDGGGKWVGDKLIFEDNAEIGGQMMHTRSIYTELTATNYTLVMEMAPKGQELKKVMTFKGTKAGAVKPPAAVAK